MVAKNKKKPIHRIVFDAEGPIRSGLHTYDPDVAERWAREAPDNAKTAGHISNPYVVHFEPVHHGWPDNHAVRILRRLGADCSLRDDGLIEVRQPSMSVRNAIGRLKLKIHLDGGNLLLLKAPEGDTHGLDLIRSVHRLHPDIVRNPDGSIELRNLYHYPDRADDPTLQPKDFATQHLLLTKAQWAKIPQVASRRHWIISQPEKRTP